MGWQLLLDDFVAPAEAPQRSSTISSRLSEASDRTLRNESSLPRAIRLGPARAGVDRRDQSAAHAGREASERRGRMSIVTCARRNSLSIAVRATGNNAAAITSLADDPAVHQAHAWSADRSRATRRHSAGGHGAVPN